MKRILIIAFHFPPDAAVGGVRPAKFAKYLPEFGWEPYVLTVDQSAYERIDTSRMDSSLSGMIIRRVQLVPSPLELLERIRYAGKSLTLFASNHQTGGTFPKHKEHGTARRHLSSLLRTPDLQQGWIVNIAMSASQMMRHYGIRTFMTSGPPMSTHIGGLIVKAITGARWVADFRDPWAAMYYFKFLESQAQLIQNMEKWLEQRVIRNADAVISTTDSLTQYFADMLPEDQKTKCFTLPNGFDEDDFRHLATPSTYGATKTILSHAGTIYFNRNPEPFFKALSDWIHRQQTGGKAIEVLFMGNCGLYNGDSLQDLISEYGLSSVVTLRGQIPYGECLQILHNSHALLLFAQGQPWQVPGKVFDYLRLNKPILAIAENGETRQALEIFPNAHVASPEDPADISAKLSTVLEAAGRRESLGQWEQIKKFDRRHLTRNLAAVLDHL